MATTTTTTPNPTPTPSAPRGTVPRPMIAAAQTAPRVVRMTAESIMRGPKTVPLRVLIYGPEKIGKTTAGVEAEGSVFIGPEDGLENFPDQPRFPEPEDWQDVLDALNTLIQNDLGHKTLVLDTADWVEPLIWAHVCRQGDEKGVPKKSIEDFGYGKGYVKALDQWRIFLSLCDRLRKKRGMNIIILAHAHIKTWKNPEGDDYDRYQLKLNEKAAGLLKEWCTVVAFANRETFTQKNDRAGAKGFSSGERFFFTEGTAAYDAGSRYRLPPRIPLEWAALEAAIRAAQSVTAENVAADIDARLAIHGDEALTSRVREAVAKAGSDLARLRRIAEHLETTIANATNQGGNAAQGE